MLFNHLSGAQIRLAAGLFPAFPAEESFNPVQLSRMDRQDGSHEKAHGDSIIAARQRTGLGPLPSGQAASPGLNY